MFNLLARSWCLYTVLSCVSEEIILITSMDSSALSSSTKEYYPTGTTSSVLTTCSSHQTWIRTSSVSSGWKLVPMTWPCRTATMLLTSTCSDVVVVVIISVSGPLPPPPPLTLLVRSGNTPRISTGCCCFCCLLAAAAPGPCWCSFWSSLSSLLSLGDNNSSTIGARMKTPGNGAVADNDDDDDEEGNKASDWARKGSSTSATKLSTWRPKWLRRTRTASPPMSSWPPFLAALACSARRMRPAQVPQVGLDLLFLFEGRFRQLTSFLLLVFFF